MVLSNIEVARILRFQCNAEDMGSTPPVYLEDVNPVLIANYQPSELTRNIFQFPIGQKALIDGFLPSGAITLQKISYPVEPSAISNVIGDKIKRSFHKKSIKGPRAGVSKRNISAILFLSLREQRSNLRIKKEN